MAGKNAKKYGRPPRYKEVQQPALMQFRFGSWNQALQAAGLEVYEGPKKDKTKSNKELYK
ncbi:MULTISPECIES: homing endonuclease associated repeat-containing protein [Bacillus]|uniref:homing endonuclease associated repeat-containing protein n=1 Tax=Bacillus TaxID=1386 RepID=UPI001C6873A1